MTIKIKEAVEVKKADLYSGKPKYLGVYLSDYYSRGLDQKFRRDFLGR